MSENEPAVEPDASGADALERAVAENPEAVAAFVERLGLVNQLLDTVELGVGALDDEMVVRLAATADVLGESADALATREAVALADSVGANASELDSALQTLVRLERSGTLDELGEAADALALVAAALDDDMVTSLVRTGTALGEVADVAAEPETARGLTALLEAVGDASSEGPPERVGMFGMVGALRDPDVQRGMGYLIAVARATGRNLDDAPTSQQ